VTDLLKLEVVRRTCRGILEAREQFSIKTNFDPVDGVLTLMSVPARSGPLGDGGRQSILDVSAALRRGTVTSIVWDHSALGWQVVWQVKPSQQVTVFVGVGGVHQFDALVELARCRPDVVAGVLVSILGGKDTHGSSAPEMFQGR
jgi:hypothetical protein